jgi:hypothetical protein
LSGGIDVAIQLIANVQPCLGCGHGDQVDDHGSPAACHVSSG